MQNFSILHKDPWLKPFEAKISFRSKLIKSKISSLGGSLSDFANGHLFYGIHREKDCWVFREWAPNAEKIYLIGTFNNWKDIEQFRFKSLKDGNWELRVPFMDARHLDLYKLRIYWKGGSGERIPAWTQRVVQDENTKIFSAQIWFPENNYVWKNDTHPLPEGSPLIYEAHTGMASENYRVGSFSEFREYVLPRIKKAGYNCIQLMAIQEHPYYGSFGYHVSSFFAPSSRFGTPEELKALIDEAHGLGIRVIMDLIHSHAVKNVMEGLGLYDGSPFQFFHDGPRRNHVAWDSLCFNYGKDEVIHFLLSNIKYWLEEYHFDGFRFDGITSMLYFDHGLNRDFTSYDLYFDGGQDEDAITYLGLSNSLIKEIKPDALSVAEEMSGYPGLAAPLEEGGLGFTHRMAMGTPDYWIKIIKELPDEKWDVGNMFYELTRKRAEEKTIAYAESHDQALVGDKTIIFRLIDKEMYTSMSKTTPSLVVDRGIALHKMIRLITLATAGNGYLNFMGNEFGHPEWIDFPREGNQWSYHYARRQWHLADDPKLKYHWLLDFDREMISLAVKYRLLDSESAYGLHVHPADQVLSFERAGLLFIFNFSPEKSYPGYGLACKPGNYSVIFSTDHPENGGFGRVDEKIHYRSRPEKAYYPNYMLQIYLPSRTAIVLKKEPLKTVHGKPRQV